ncbi:MAG: sigma-54-dependent transcriptional regulator, partial [Thermodesulfobacteriota bacterium]
MKEKFKVLVADDDDSVVWVLERFLHEKGLVPLKASDGYGAQKVLGEPGVQLAFLDINMPVKDGLQVLKDARAAGSTADVIIMTAESTMKNTLEAMKLGAFDYITKPFDLSELEIILDRAMENIRLKVKVEDLTERLREIRREETAFVGKSRAVQNVFKTIGKVAPKDVTVLILGESGTG